MDEKKYVIGMDCGGTKTVALLADETGKVLGRGDSGTANMNIVGRERTVEVIREAAVAASRMTSTVRLPGCLWLRWMRFVSASLVWTGQRKRNGSHDNSKTLVLPARSASQTMPSCYWKLERQRVGGSA